jgi:hypothetical protein
MVVIRGRNHRNDSHRKNADQRGYRGTRDTASGKMLAIH